MREVDSIMWLKVFRPYAKFWLSPLLELILSRDFNTDAAASACGGINYFINDVLVTLLSWHPVAVPQVPLLVCPSLTIKSNYTSYVYVTFHILWIWGIWGSYGLVLLAGHCLAQFSSSFSSMLRPSPCIYLPSSLLLQTSEMSLVGRLMDFIMTHCHHDNRQVLRNNLDVLKTVVEVWQSTVHIPTVWVSHLYLFTLFTCSDNN